MIKIGSFFGLLLCFQTAALAQSPEVKAFVDRNRMGKGDTFTLTISVSSEQSVSVNEPRLPNLKAFELLNTWQGVESQSTFSNGKFEVKQTKKFNYMLMPNKEGVLTIAPIEIVVNGKPIKTSSIKINVSGVAKRQRPSDRKQKGADPFSEAEDLFSRLLRQRPGRQGSGPPVDPDEAFFIQVEVDKKKVYEGEQVTASWYIYTRGQIRDIDTLRYPSLKGFWKEDIEVATRLNFRNEIVNGIVYQRALLASYALFPIKAGKAKIDSYKARCVVVTPSAFGFGRPFKITKESKPVKINILPVPKKNRPANYTGAVGQFNVSSSLDSKEVPLNQPVTLKIRFEGRGNAKLIDLPKVEFPDGIELYDTKKEARFYKDGRSYKVFELLLIPRKQGKIELPAFSVSMFDPITRKFYLRTTSPLDLFVQEGQQTESISPIPLVQNPIGEEQNKAASLPGPVLTWQASRGLNPVYTVTIWAMAFLIAVATLFWQAHIELGLGRRKKGLNQLLKKRFSEVYEDLDKKDFRSVGIGVTNLVYFLLGEISGQGGANREIGKLMLKVPPSVRREIAEPLKKLMNRFDTLSFAPEEMQSSLKNKSEIKKLIAEMERLLTRAVQLGLGQKVELSQQHKE